MYNFTESNMKKLACAVLAQAAKDYKKDYTERYSIEKWIEKGNIWCDIALPEMTSKDIIGGFRKYANE